jgi:2-polyprenyl-6-methoxyphenol hydroxylase-like FAD-dependent oxidoreductase
VRTAVLASDLRRVAPPTNGHGVIIGGGIGGLLAAHALAGRFERVTILERFRYPRDSISPAPPARRGVPQSRCIHLLMAAGAAAFDKLVPGWSEELVARGAGPFDASADAVLRFPAGWLPRTPSGITTYACSRALLEKVLRAGLAGTVHVREEQKVLGLVSSLRGDRVTGVYMAERQATRGTTLLADLVVDASGEGSTLARWLSCLPNGPRSQADKTVVESGMQYVSCWFHMKSKDAPNWRCLSIAPTVDGRLRSAMMLRAEEDRWGVALLAPAGEPLPSDEKAFLDFVAGLGEGELRAALARARPVSPILRYGATSNRMVHYERLTAWPSGLVAIGDSVCTLDPYFGLGMTATARGVVLLRTYLDEGNGEVSLADFQNELASLNAQPWRLATGRDPGGGPLGLDKTHLSRLYQAAPSNSEIAHALLGVQHLVRPAETLKEFAV